ncbi:phosphatase PAP2 family protein [Brevibacterium sp. UCMA 11754]|uniref:phosphatase PAP2 family protein n=1 Tax=Brevibacterium sp. UCMA 11754 TaxID=2749198 RepID=UPI001F29F764|nr:phosphatase PAP2 family protein [Brevibacterium sp. UCMA 11754]MCF2570963.1 phosphatase PAP2 family protein [Brevibacterium sp. UCMA 11754]MCF2570964.1 phosphatase PAP2 family protein [Brevibacterium sp. UCMA 11754]MCF2573075.1 phosphatase PAP2 family protein [Brevibacterium sp. UCMA 11754]MCF2573080.1 phosphatase PAP2 family protein [Brevibacterium sp. UCMA 11754]
MSVRQPSWILWSTLPVVLLVVAFGLWLRVDVSGPTTVDQDWLNLVGLEPDTSGYWLAVILAEVGGGTGAVICTGLLAALFILLRRFRSAGVLVTTMLMGIVLSELLKAVVTRVRPSEQLYDSLGYSYPSGHSMGAAALALGLAFIASRAHMLRLAGVGAVPPLAIPPENKTEPVPTDTETAPTETAAVPTEITAPLEPVRLRFHWSMLLAFAWILLMMWSRTALQVHWLSDTIAGALIGISAAVLADELWTWATIRSRSPHRQG